MTHLFARLRIRALGVAARVAPAPTPFMLTGPGSSVGLARLIADRGARSVLVVTDPIRGPGGNSPSSTTSSFQRRSRSIRTS
jgi:hypothetical protein